MNVKDKLIQIRGFEKSDLSEWKVKKCTPDSIEKMSEYQIIRALFGKDSIIYGFSSQYLDEPYSEFSKTPEFVSPACLDPFVARFVGVINRIGIRTIQCCDGWHKESDIGLRRAYIKYPERYSLLLMWLIEEYVFGQKWSSARADESLVWENIWKPEMYPDGQRYGSVCISPENCMVLNIAKGNEEAVYSEMNKQAAFIEENIVQFSKLKSAVIESFDCGKTTGLLAQRRQMRCIIADYLEELGGKYILYDWDDSACFSRIIRLVEER